MRGALAIILLALTAIPAGCVSTPSLAPAQVEEMQTRRIDAAPDVAFRAVAGVMLDRGMIIVLSDASAGLIGASGSAQGQCSHGHTSPGAPDAPTQIVVWVRPDTVGTSLIRVQFSQGGLTSTDRELVSRFAEDVGKRTLAASTKRSAR